MSVFHKFLKSECGAVSADFVVLTASVLGFALLVVVSIVSGINDVSTGIGAELSAAVPPEADFSLINNPDG